MSNVVVIIPALNVEHTLPRQLAALDRQSDLDFRVIVSDNGSTDGTRSVCAAWQPRFTSLEVVDSSARPGVAGARNVGIQSSSEDLVLICDGDDEVHPNWVEAHRSCLGEADGSTGPLHCIFVDDPHRREIWFPDQVPTSMGFRPYLPGGNMGVRRTALDATGLFDEGLRLGQEDVDLGWRMARLGLRLAHAPEASLDYYQRSGWRRLLRQQYRYGRAHAQLCAKHADDGPPAASWKASARWFWEWAKQFPAVAREGRTRLSVGAAVFQIGRVRESVRLGVRTHL